MTTNDIVKNRSEIVFLYDVKDANPNGDPLDENKPRIDEETGINIVTDVRLKRTIRDYLHDFGNQEIFIREVKKDDGKLKTKEDRLDDLKIKRPDDLLNKCIDIRLFGATTAIKDRIITFTGPVQFKIGKSMHRVTLKFIKGTTVMPSKEAKGQGTFTEEYILPYSLIAFYGIINENAAQHTRLTNGDVTLLLDGMWNGTKNLISRSKVGQMPRLLLKVNYKEKDYHIGDLDKLIKIKDIEEIHQEKIRDISEIELDVTQLINALSDNEDKIKDIEYLVDERVNLVSNGKKVDFSNLDGIKSNQITF